jgi:hypothetical protein
VRGFVLLALGVALAGCDACARPARAESYRDPSRQLRTPVGTNLDFLVDWSTAMPFVDLMKTSRPWISGTRADFDGGAPLDVDARGWVRSLAPGQVARTLMVWDATTHPAGRYVVTWRGSGEVDFFAGASGRCVERAQNRAVLDLDPRRDGPGIGLAILRTDPGDPIRDVRVLVPGGSCTADRSRLCDEAHPCGEGACEPFERSHEAHPFHPEFLRSMGTYSAIRFMNWADANSTITPSFEVTFSDRAELEDARWAPRAPLEVMIDLANRTGAEPWITLPSRCDDDYARRAGALFRERLDPHLRVWVEYSNEVWNTMFPQSAFAAERGMALGLADDPDLATLRFYSRRTGELHRAFAEGFGDASRVVRVYAGQSASPWRGEQILDYEGAATRADAYAIGAYFGHTVRSAERQEWARLDLDRFFARASGEYLDLVRREIAASAEVARERNLSLVAYEGGQHFVGYDDAQGDARITELFASASRDPRMEDLYLRYLGIWREEGGALLMHHVDCAAGGPHGYWGATEWLGQPLSEAPKRRALLRFASQHARR